MQVSIRLSPVPGFPILPVLDYVPRLVLLDPRSPVFCPGFPILPVPDYVLGPVPVDLPDEVKIGISLYLLVSESCFWVQICQSL